MDSINAPLALTRVEAAAAASKVRRAGHGALWALWYWWVDLDAVDKEEYRKMLLAGVLLAATIAVRVWVRFRSEIGAPEEDA